MKPIVSKKIRNAARGEECCFQIVGVCNHNPETTVLCHLPDESKGMGLKADDLSAAFGCHECHSAVDGRRPGRNQKSHIGTGTAGARWCGRGVGWWSWALSK